ncbi:DUF5320 domain-containing protein [Chloroflexota bacterium]
MPGFYGTGPCGKGPITGGGMGYCIVPLDTPEQEACYLKNRVHVLDIQLRRIKARINELEEVETVSRV